MVQILRFGYQKLINNSNMAKIAIIDDNPDQSGTVQNNIEIELKKMRSTIEVITSLPFADPNDFFNYIQKNEVCVLIIDEMLNDQSIGERGPVSYKGNQLVTTLREHLKEIPIFALTVIPTDPDLKSKFSQYEDIISRKEFYDNAEVYVPKFWRAAKNYLKENIDEFNEFNELTKEISGGNNDPTLLKRLQALQVKLELPFSGFDDRKNWLNKYEDQINSLEKLNTLIKSKLGK
jgi:hypothetical protein